MEGRLRGLFAAAGCDGFLHVRDLDGRRRYAIAIFTRLHALYQRGREADDAIGEAGRIAVESLHRRV